MKATRDIKSVIDEMIDHIDYVGRKLRGRSVNDFHADRDVRQIVERSLEIISEASRRLTPELQKLAPEIPWRQVADFGNVLRHAYFDVDPDIVWDIATKQLAPLRAALTIIRDHLR
jgi:uncharacterized protein with HEPN domain